LPAVLASGGLAALLKNTAKRGYKIALAALFFSLILIEYLVVFPFPMTGGSVPQFYLDVARDRRDYAILDLPPGEDYSAFTHYIMYYQMFHQHPIIWGFTYRLPPFAALVTESFRQLVARSDIVDYSLEDLLQILNQFNIKYVVLHKGFLTEGEERVDGAFLQALGEPIYEDSQISAFLVPERGGERATPGPLLILGNEWHLLEQWDVPSRWMGREGTIYIRTMMGKEYRLRFTSHALGERLRTLQVFADEELWQEFKVGNALYEHLSKPLLFQEGWHRIRFRALEGCQRPVDLFPDIDDARCLSILFQEVELD